MTRLNNARTPVLLALAGALSLSLWGAAATEAEAGFLKRKPEGDMAYAESRFGNGHVSGPVRVTRTGYEVRKPNGTWIACRRSCAETLRVETVDFFENNDGTPRGYGTAANECGIFGCLDFHVR